MNHIIFSSQKWNLPNAELDLTDEANCFGLGAGMSFFYAVARKTPQNFLMGRSKLLHENFLNNLKIEYEAREFNQAEELLAFTREQIAAGQPVVIQSDVHFLPYYNSPLHFTGHTFTAVGYDSETILTSDTHFKEFQKADSASFLKAVEFPSPIFPGKNKCYVIRGQADTSPENIRFAIRQSLQQTQVDYSENLGKDLLSSQQLYCEASTGIAGLKYFKNYFENNIDECRDLNSDAMFLYQLIEHRGTGGGAFRLMMAEFYQNCSIYTGNKRFAKLTEITSRLAASYKDFAAFFRGVYLSKVAHIDQYEQKAQLPVLVKNIFDQETEQLEMIAEILGKW